MQAKCLLQNSFYGEHKTIYQRFYAQKNNSEVKNLKVQESQNLLGIIKNQ